MSSESDRFGRDSAAWADAMIRSTRRWTFLLMVVFVAVFGGLGAFMAEEASTRPGLNATMKILFGLFYVAVGLGGLFRLAAYGPEKRTQNRVEHSVANSGLLLFGVSQLAANGPVRISLLVLGSVCLLAALL